MDGLISFLYTEFMHGLVRPGLDVYYYFMETKSDPRTYDWFLMSSPVPLLTVLAVYLYFCVWAGPNYMKDRKPFELKYVMMLYNIFQIMLSTYIMREHLKGGWAVNYSFACQPVDYSNDPMAVRMASSVWWYFMGEVIELLDTVFFVLRKKNSQVSFLHLYHHSMMPVCSWIGAKFLAGGHGTLLGLINSFIHIIMYSYYLITSLGPSFQKYLWWKRHLTEMQMIQYLMLFLHNAQALFRHCDFPKTVNFLFLSQQMFLLYLFIKLYLYSHVLKENKTPTVNVNVLNGHIKQE